LRGENEGYIGEEEEYSEEGERLRGENEG